MQTAASSSSRLEQQGTHAIFTTALSAGLGLLLSVVVARALGPAGKGTLDLCSATVALFALVFGGSLNTAITHVVARQSAVPRGLVLQLGGWAAGGALLTALMLTLFTTGAVRLGLLPASDTRFWIGFVVVSVAAGIYAAALRGILIGRNAVIAANRIDVVIKAAILGGCGVAAYAHFADAQSFAIVSAAAAIGLLSVLMLAVRAPATRTSGVWRQLAAVAVPVHGTNIVHFLNQRADVFFVQAFHGATEVGLYTLAVSLAQCVLLVSAALAVPLLPEVSAAGSATAAGAAAAATCRRFLALGVIASVGLATLGAWLLPAIFGRDFSGSRPALLILLPGVLGFGLTNILISYFVGCGRSSLNLGISLVTLLVTLAGNAILTRRLGALGAAATSSVAYFVAAGLSLWCFRRANAGTPLAALWPSAADWRAAALVAAHFRV